MNLFNKIFSIIIVFVFLFPVYAKSADRYVLGAGSDTGNDCTVSTAPCATINRAVNQAGSGDTVKIAQGVYHESISPVSYINPLTIQGGWNANFSQRNENPALTTIDGDDTNRVFKISLISADITLEGLTITGGYNANSGGGIYASADNQTILLTLQNLILESNNSDVNGGAVFVEASQSGNLALTIENSIIRQNEAVDGAGVFLSVMNDGAVTATIKNSFITDNDSVVSSGGLKIYSYNGNVETDLICNTITNNTSWPANPDSGGAVYILSGSSSGETAYSSIVNSTNNIIWGNSGNDIIIMATDPVLIAQVNARYSDIGNVDVRGIDGGMGIYNDNGNNVDANPLLTGDYHLKGASPCINAGIYQKRTDIGGGMWAVTYYNVPSEDFEGDSRIGDWVPVSSSTEYRYCDMGADEYTSSTNTSILYLLLNN